MTTLLALLPVLVPALCAVAHFAAGHRRGPAKAALPWLLVGSAAVLLGDAIVLAALVLTDGPVVAAGGLLRADALSVFMLVVIAAVALLSGLATPAHLAAERAAGRAGTRTAARYCALVQLFVASMAAAVLAADLGVLWVAVEGTTIVTAFLVGVHRSRAAVEAAWKYVVICSAGIALALLGLVLLHYAAHRAGTGAGLDWAALVLTAPTLDPGVTRLAVVLLIIGFGTKAGLAPLHAWLPDAHSQAPAPVSALMSGVLLSVAFYAVLRTKVIADLAVGPEFAQALLLASALASLAMAASLLIAQRDYKRMLAYSSIEHMGLLALGAAIGGPAAIAAVLLHVLGHGLVKSVLFVGAGRLLQIRGTSRIAEVRGLAADQPVLAGCLGAGVLALIGMPPFSIFASELGIARAGFAAGSAPLAWATAIALVLVLVIAAAMVNHTSRMLLGEPGPRPEPSGGTTLTRTASQLAASTGTALIGGLVLAAALGITAGPLAGLLDAATRTLTGGTP